MGKEVKRREKEGTRPFSPSLTSAHGAISAPRCVIRHSSRRLARKKKKGRRGARFLGNPSVYVFKGPSGVDRLSLPRDHRGWGGKKSEGRKEKPLAVLNHLHGGRESPTVAGRAPEKGTGAPGGCSTSRSATTWGPQHPDVTRLCARRKGNEKIPFTRRQAHPFPHSPSANRGRRREVAGIPGHFIFYHRRLPVTMSRTGKESAVPLADCFNQKKAW